MRTYKALVLPASSSFPFSPKPVFTILVNFGSTGFANCKMSVFSFFQPVGTPTLLPSSTQLVLPIVKFSLFSTSQVSLSLTSFDRKGSGCYK